MVRTTALSAGGAGMSGWSCRRARLNRWVRGSWLGIMASRQGLVGGGGVLVVSWGIFQEFVECGAEAVTRPEGPDFDECLIPSRDF